MGAINANTRKTFNERTHEGAVAARMTPIQALRRSVLSCMLWEGEFYEDGVTIADRIQALAQEVPVDSLAALAIEAREVAKLRHAPLLLLVVLAKRGSGSALVSSTIERVIQRADELSEFLALYWAMNPPRDARRKAPLSAQVKKGLAAAFVKFDPYQIAKYDRAKDVRLRDVLFLAHVKPKSAEQGELLGRLVENALEAPDTWEVALSGGADKKETFERLLRENKLGYLALLRNLRNMEQAGVDRTLVNAAIRARKGADRVLPFRYTAAARYAPSFEPALDQALVESIKAAQPLKGSTVVLVDVSGSMNARLSAKSDLTRMDAGATLASIVPGDDVRVFTFSNALVETPARKGMAGVDAIRKSQPWHGTALASAIRAINENVQADRLIVITDEQAQAENRGMPAPKASRAYMINVASAKNGVGYGNGWTHIDGFSENVLRYIAESEAIQLDGVTAD
ncbi:RNA-binding protein [Brevundimonas phage vB_BpoS-Kikimora]|uniref:RNA-binding protein n=1 Tax=Brevundimonas phage vB_BpoS-Kikimora TaxID=2948601 RepID=A0A9E7SMU6_9CAUD|nr:RNA-binding protein [Brevundimonas phage vB_BpoS-Kikimora]